MQERRNSIANALELRLDCTNPSQWKPNIAPCNTQFSRDSFNYSSIPVGAVNQSTLPRHISITDNQVELRTALYWRLCVRRWFAPFITQGTISPLDYTIHSKQTLQWCHNDHDGVPKLRATGLCVGNSPGPVTRKMFPFDDVIMWTQTRTQSLPEIHQTTAY